MAQDKVDLAIFDFDGTLTVGHLWEGVARHHKEKRVKRRAILLYFLTHLPFWLAASVKLYPKEKDRIKWGEDLSGLFKSFTVEEGKSAFEWVTDNYILPLMRKDVLDVLVRHKEKNDRVMILSGMFTDFLDVVGQRLGIDYIVGTKLEVVDGRYSGKIIPPLCFGENKARLLKEFVQANQLEVNYTGSYAYADSIFDLPVFRLVGNPVATYPDKDLYRLARAERWPIIGNGPGNPTA